MLYIIAAYSILIVIFSFTNVLVFGFSRLEPCEGRLSRTVLRGRGHSNVSLLPGMDVSLPREVLCPLGGVMRYGSSTMSNVILSERDAMKDAGPHSYGFFTDHTLENKKPTWCAFVAYPNHPNLDTWQCLFLYLPVIIKHYPPATPTSTPTNTPTSVPTATWTPTNIPTSTPRPTFTSTPTNIPTPTNTLTATLQPTSTPTSIPTATDTAIPTDIPP